LSVANLDDKLKHVGHSSLRETLVAFEAAAQNYRKLPVPILKSVNYPQHFGAFLFKECEHENDGGAGGNSRYIR